MDSRSFDMSVNYTSEQYESEESYDDYSESRWFHILLSLDFAVLMVTLLTLICGAASWCIIKKFRNYRNFVFLNAILSNFLLYLTSFTFLLIDQETHWTVYVITRNLYEYSETVKSHWLVIISHTFYVDFVKVFNVHVRRRYLKASVFGWGASLITTAIVTIANECLPNLSQYGTTQSLAGRVIWLFFVFGDHTLPLVVNSFFYIVIVFSLCLSINTSAQTASNICRRLYISTVIFILGDVLLLCDYAMETMTEGSYIKVFVFIKVFTKYNPIILNVFFVVLRSNRKIWYEFYINKINQRRRNRDFNMLSRNAQTPGDDERIGT